MTLTKARYIPLYSLFLVFLGSVLTSLTYRVMPYIGIQLERRFPTGFVVYVTCVCLAVVIVISILKTRGWKMSDIGFKRPKRNMIFMGLLFLAIGMFVVFPISLLINKALGVEMKGIDHSIENVGDVLVAILVCSVIGPLGEEILFRGFLIKVAQQKITNKWILGTIALLSFAAIHVLPFGIGGMVFIILWAILPVFLFVHYDNIYPGYIMHALGNLWVFLFIPLLFRR
jgi:membrane protease YdiL (CAAX protease family)